MNKSNEIIWLLTQMHPWTLEWTSLIAVSIKQFDKVWNQKLLKISSQVAICLSKQTLFSGNCSIKTRVLTPDLKLLWQKDDKELNY
jgi:hypothetical protein